MLSPEYYWVLEQGGILGTCTDVPALEKWNKEQVEEFGLLEEVKEGVEDMKNIIMQSDEADKFGRENPGGEILYRFYRKNN